MITALLILSLAQAEVVTSSIVYSAVAGKVEYHRMKDRQLYKENNIEYKDHSRAWHKLEALSTLSAFSVGVTIALDSYENEINYKRLVSNVLLASAIRWIVYDAVYNTSHGNGMFHQSKNTYSAIENIGTWYNKILYLLLTSVLRYVW